MKRIIYCMCMALSLCFVATSCEDNFDDLGVGYYPLNESTHPDAYAIDLGLSVRWASCNVGAKSPEEYGGYYAWGETEEKSYYDWDTYKWCRGTRKSMTKYCVEREYGAVDNKTTLDPADDVAHVKWGGKWRMPTEIEIEELEHRCHWTRENLNGVSGFRVTGPNGNSIFIPRAGYWSGTKCYSGSLKMWSSSLYYGYYACDMDDDDVDKTYRCRGCSVRPVVK